MQKLGGMGGVLGMLPGVGKIKKQLDAANLDDRILKRQQAMIGSMTKAERKNPKLLNAKRKKRVAAGSGTIGAGHQPAGEDAPADGRHDEGDGQEARHLQPDVRIGGRPEMPAELPPGATLPPGGLPPLPPGGFPGLGGGLPRGIPWPARRTPRPSRPAGFQETMRST